MVKCYAQEKRVFDINKVTVVGSPSISEDGVASGFSSKSSGIENYLTFPTVFNPASNTWKIIIKATIGEWTSNIPYASLLGTGIQEVDNQGIALAITNNQISCWLRSNTGTGWDIGNIRTTFTYTTGETYYFQIEFTGTKYVLSVSKDRKNWEIKGSIESSLPIYVSTQPLAIGDNKYNNSASTCWTGSIDLMETYVYIGDQVFFNPTKPTYLLERRKEGFDLSKFTVVGSPIITEDGMLTTNNKTQDVNYLKIPLNINNANTLSFKFKYIAKKKDWDGAFVLLGGGNQNALGFLQIYHYISNLHIRIFFKNEDSTIDFQNIVFSKTINQEGEFNFYLNKNGNDYSIELVTPNGAILNTNFTETRPLSVPLNQYIGWANIVDCSIDLKQFSITVDGKEVFTGAKEKFYAMQGGI